LYNRIGRWLRQRRGMLRRWWNRLLRCIARRRCF
jgi:hypothetical protein